jgi:hypothetical protein
MSNVTDVKPVIVKVGDVVEIKAKGITFTGTVTSASNPMVNKDGFLFKGYDANDYVVELVSPHGVHRNWHGVSDGGTIRVVPVA